MAGPIKILIAACCVLAIAGVFFAPGFAAIEDSPTQPLAEAKSEAEDRSIQTTVDHSKLEPLKEEFKSGPEVTRACISCHTEAARQFQQTIHWTWICPAAGPESGLGKAGTVINNFCINVQSNEPRCTSCHAGYGWKDNTFDLTVEQNVDCLVCHEQTGTYEKFPTMAGHVVSEPTVFKGSGREFLPPDLNKVAQSVARPTRDNCGTCHFYGGGGDGVKHGDLDSSMFNPSRELDVHMGVDGGKFACVRCHTTEAHFIAGRCYKKPAAEDRRSLVEDDLISRITCVSCHTDKPHKPGVKADDHTDKVACQTCHIPTFARVNPTKMWWDWSKAGDKKREMTKDKYGKPTYDPKKGEFIWAKNVVPEYYWFNGTILNVQATDKIDAVNAPISLTTVVGGKDDPNSLIYPFKVHRGKQPYDKVNSTMVIPHLFGKPGTGAYWGGWDWGEAITVGMEYAGLPYSGKYDFIETEYHFPITHMVAPAENVVACAECHSRNGRLAELSGFYMPGRDSSAVLNYIGWTVVIASLIGVLIHAVVRMVSPFRRREG